MVVNSAHKNGDNMELKIVNFKKCVTTAGDTWNESAYGTIETPSELTYEFDGCESRCSDFGATKDELIAKAIKAESWNTWFYEMGGEDKTFQEVGLESPMVFVPEEDCEISVDGIGDFINNGKGLCPKTMYLEVKEQLLEIALNAVEITVMDENGEDITSQFSSLYEEAKEEKSVVFKIAGKNCYYEIEGVININSVDDDEPDIKYFDGQGFLTNQRCVSMDDSSETQDVEDNVCESSSEILQALWDFQDDEKVVEFEKFHLIINVDD